MSDLHDRVAKVLGWSTKDVQSVSMHSLRDLVRPVDPDLARELSYAIQSGAYIRGKTSAPHRATIAEKKAPKDVEAAVRAAQLYIGSATASPVRDQQRLYNSMRRKIAAIAKRRGIDEATAHEQIFGAAQSRGAIIPLPGRDV